MDGLNHSFEVDDELGGQRVDRILSALMAGHSRSRLAKWIREGLVLVDGRAVRPSTTVVVGAVITVSEPEPPPTELIPQEMDLSIVYEDEHLAVINKPAGLIVHPGAGHPDGTLVNGLIHRYGELSPIGAPTRPGVVHRIDAGTSGILVVARTEVCHTGLASQFSDHSAERIYRALVWDHGLEDEGTIHTDYCRHPKERRKYTGQLPADRHAVTHWRVRERLRPCAWVDVKLETGRTHQIRVHMSEAGQPLVGDAMYGRRRRIEHIPKLRVRGWELGLKRQALHAAVLGFKHPITGDFLRFETEPPQDILDVLDALRSAQ